MEADYAVCDHICVDGALTLNRKGFEGLYMAVRVAHLRKFHTLFLVTINVSRWVEEANVVCASRRDLLTLPPLAAVDSPVFPISESKTVDYVIRLHNPCPA